MFSITNQGIPDGEPEPTYTVLDFSEANYSGAGFSGQFYEVGEWSIEEDILTLDGKLYQITELTKQKLVYVTGR